MPEPNGSAEMIERFAAQLTEGGKHSENTIAAYSQDAEAFATWLAGEGGTLLSVTSTQVQTWIDQRTKRGPRSAGRKLSALRGMYKFLLAENLIESDPTTGVKMPPTP